VAAYVVGTPWHLAQEHHHDGAPAETHADGHAEDLAVDHESHCHPEDHSSQGQHSRAEHVWAGLPPQSLDWALCKVLLTLPSAVLTVALDLPAQTCASYVHTARPPAPPRRASRPRGPPLS